MSIAEFIRESVLRPRLKQAGALVVYDADKRYRELCLDLASDKVRVVDASESSIESREAALLALCQLGWPNAPLDAVLRYVPAKWPESDPERYDSKRGPMEFLKNRDARTNLNADLANRDDCNEAAITARTDKMLKEVMSILGLGEEQ